MNAKVMSRPLNSIPGFALDGFPVSDSIARAHTHGDGMDAPSSRITRVSGYFPGILATH